MAPLTLAGLGLGAVLALMTLVWIASLARRDASLVDRVWGFAFVLLAWVYQVAGGAEGARSLLVPILVTVWGSRLSLYLTWRNWGEGEDYRYVEMRRRQGSRFAWVSLFSVFWLQAGIAWLVALPLLAIQRANATELGWLDALGTVFFSVGLLFETVGDYQLTRFRADPANRGKVLDRGLWRYTRHPNYFGDAMVWWGLGLFALATPNSWWSLAGPVLMSFFLMRVSGVALLEKTLARTKPAYRDYVRKTSAFFPLPPRD